MNDHRHAMHRALDEGTPLPQATRDALAADPLLAREWEELQAIDAAARETEAPPPAPAELRARVLATVAAEPRARAPWWGPWAAAASIAAALAIAAGPMVLERPAPQEPPRAAIELAALPPLPSVPRLAPPEGLRAAGEDLRWTARTVIANTVGLVPRGS